ncbi:hypothetical protein T08_12379 [Trichinella sp. T8]|nr:hypothetical protein T08_12379 [Trichinella sp. T8]
MSSNLNCSALLFTSPAPLHCISLPLTTTLHQYSFLVTIPLYAAALSMVIHRAPGLGARRVANVNRQWAARSPRGVRANCGADLNYRWLPRLRCNDRSSGSSDDPPPELFAQEAVIRLPQEASSDPDPGSINAEIVIYRAVSAYCS